jgi:hypothetical protein
VVQFAVKMNNEKPMNDQKEGGISDKNMEKTVRNILLGLMGILIITLLSLRACEEVIKKEQREAQIENNNN